MKIHSLNKINLNRLAIPLLALSLMAGCAGLFGGSVSAVAGEPYTFQQYKIQKDSNLDNLDDLKDGDFIHYKIKVDYNGMKLCEWMGYVELSAGTSDVDERCSSPAEGGFYITDVLGDGLELVTESVTTDSRVQCQKQAGKSPYKNSDGSSGWIFCLAKTDSPLSPNEVSLNDFSASYNVEFDVKYRPAAISGKSIINYANIHPSYYDVMGLTLSSNTDKSFGRCTFSPDESGYFIKDGVRQILNNGADPKPFNNEGCISSYNKLIKNDAPAVETVDPGRGQSTITDVVVSDTNSKVKVPSTGAVLISLILIPIVVGGLAYLYIAHQNKSSIKKKSER